MFDIGLRRLVDPALNRIAAALVKQGVGANRLTFIGAGVAIGVCIALAREQFIAALLLIIFNRILDGLDGAVARINGATSFGGYLDSIADYIFYLAVPLGFALARPENQLPALWLIASFTLTAVSFLAFAAIFNSVKKPTADQGPKAFYYSRGFIEGGETILCFVLMACLPVYFATIALTFTGLCLATVGQRLWMASRMLD
jgi:phosphatidylglycerophosphate synthase